MSDLTVKAQGRSLESVKGSHSKKSLKLQRKEREMVTHVGTRVRVNDLENAAMGLGLTSEAAKTTIIRGALALFHDLDPLQYTQPSRNHTEMIEISTPVPDELAVVPEGMTRATAIRIGLALARGMTREEAEEWATDPDNFKGLYRGYRRNT